MGEALTSLIAGPILRAADTAQMGIAVSVVEEDTIRRVYVSEVACRILGCSSEELLASPTLLSFPPEEVERMRTLSSDWVSGRSVPTFLESVLLRKDGARVPVEVAFSRVEIEGKPASVSFFRDISDRKRTEHALRKSEDMFRKLIEAAPEAVAVSRADGLVYVNPRCLELTGYEDVAELGAAYPLELIHPEDRRDLLERRHSIESSTTLREPREYRLLRKGGAEVAVECSSLAIEFEGEPAILTFMRDVTARKESQAQIIQADRMATIGMLAATVAHELNNPLAYVVLNLGILGRELEGILDRSDEAQRIRERLRVLHEGVSHTVSVVGDLRSFCRPNSPARPLDVRSILESAINMAMSQIESRARLVRNFSSVPSVVADGARLGQVFLNLLLNAAQSFDETDSRDREVRVMLRSQGDDQVRIEISDTGRGMAPEILGRIFEPFFTANPVGTGLGLSISKTIVTSMRGQLLVESAPGKGSTFIVVLPAARENDDIAREEELDAPTALGPSKREERLRLLVVDDEAALVTALHEVLAVDHEVTTLTTGARALELLLNGHESDVILCDILMPGMSGIDLYRALERERPALLDRMIFMSAASFMPRVTEFLEQVPNPRIEKPIDVAQLRELIRATNDRRAVSAMMSDAAVGTGS
ncbi:MAG: hybrid sensor histidine kinase/response regulator [Polyangiales bacterium]